MTEITQFNGKYVMHEGMFIYSCAPCNIDCSGRYVRESDYAALRERHRRLVEAASEVSSYCWFDILKYADVQDEQ